MTTNHEANRDVHRVESLDFRGLHPELYGRPEGERIERMIRAVHDACSGDRKPHVLDIAAGAGRLSIPFAANNCSVTALDYSPDMLRTIMEDPVYQTGNITCVTADAREYLLTNDTRYDAIVMGAFLHHVIDIHDFLRIVISRVKKGGIIGIIHDPALRSTNALRFGRIFERIDSLLFQVGYALTRGRMIPRLKAYGAADIHTKKGINNRELVSYIMAQGCPHIIHEEYYSHKTVLATYVDAHLLKLLPQFYVIAKKE